MRSRLTISLIIATGIGAMLCMPLHTASTQTYAAAQQVMVQEATVGGGHVGEVLVGGQVVFRIRTSAGGYTPYERAEMVADRIQAAMGDSLRPEDVSMARIDGQDVVTAGGKVLITADPAEARLNGTTTASLASLWSQRLSSAIAGDPVESTPTGQKVVPIISVGKGTRVGGALVSGAKSRLDEVVAVAQLDGEFGNAVRVRALVPVSTKDVVKDISRVPETAVTGLVDIKL